MRIINALDPSSEGVESAVRALANHADRVTAACGRKLLELVQYLQDRGPTPEVEGGLMFAELTLVSGNGVSVNVWVDWPDYGPAADGIPVMHYRLQIHSDGPRSRDARASTPAEAERVILEAFGLL